MLNATPPRVLAHAELRHAIAAAGDATSAAAKRLDCSHSYLIKVLRGEHVPTDRFRLRAAHLYGVAAWRWDPRSLDRDTLIAAGIRPGELARRLQIKPSLVLSWWRGQHVGEVAEAVAPLLAELAPESVSA